jgi:hypothetical protein
VRDWVDPARGILVPAGGSAILGGLSIALATRGAADRPLLTGLVLVAGVAAGLAPLRFGLPVAIVLASFGGLLTDFAGSRADYWNELFVGLLLVRAVIRRRPSTLELGIGAGVGVVFLAYLVTGSTLREVFWGGKVLLMSVLAGWAIYRLRPGPRSWRATCEALWIAAGANVLLAAWQHHVGSDRLRELGIPVGERIKETSGGALRAFGGFTSPAPFSYALVIAALVWLAVLLGSVRDRRLALYAAWVPLAALLGIQLSLDRTALLGLVAAVIVVGLRELRNPRSLVLVAAAVGVVVGVVAIGSAQSRHFFGEALTLSSPSAKQRVALWRSYLGESSFFGVGPASAGAAYLHADPPTPQRPVWLWAYWRPDWTRSGRRLYAMEKTAVLRIGLGGKPRPATTLTLRGKSLGEPRTLTVRFDPNRHADRRVLARAALDPQHAKTVTVAVPAAREPAYVLLSLSPPPRSKEEVNPATGRPVGAEFDRMSVSGLRKPATPAEAVYEKAFGLEEVGVVDNLYLSWIFQYGILGVGLCALWLWVLLRPLAGRLRNDAPALSARLVGVFLVVGAVAVNIWEEAPIDFYAAAIFAIALSWDRLRRRRSHRPRTSTSG